MALDLETAEFKKKTELKWKHLLLNLVCLNNSIMAANMAAATSVLIAAWIFNDGSNNFFGQAECCKRSSSSKAKMIND